MFFQLFGTSEQLKKHLEHLTEKERSVCKCNYSTQKFLLGRYIVEQEQQGTVKMLQELGNSIWRIKIGEMRLSNRELDNLYRFLKS